MRCLRRLLYRRLTLTCAGAMFAAMLTAGQTLSAQGAAKFYFWVTPTIGQKEPQSFVIEVDAAQKSRIDQILSERGFPGFGGRIAAGATDYNRNYYAPGQPVWNWHVASVDEIFDRNGSSFPHVVDPELDANPSDIAADPERWIRENGPEYIPRYYEILREVDPSKKDAIANVSNRGMAGAGEKALITGIIISGGEPRNVVVRALGPSMSATGVQQPAANPKIEVYEGSRLIAANTDWKTGTRSSSLSASYSALAPTNDKEAALLLTLVPGTYTLHGLNEDGTEGVVLLEAYDVDSTQ